jgi:hypothetical protein
MNGSRVRGIYIGRNSDQHFIFRKRNLYDFVIRELKYYVSRGNEARDLLFGPIPFVGNRYRLNGIDIIQFRFIRFPVALAGARRKQPNYS